MNTPNIWLVIPAYNEATAIGAVLAEIEKTNYQMVVVDDCSKDETSLVAGKHRAHIAKHLINLGQGAALQTGISYALKQGADYIVSFDADGQHRLEDVERMLQRLIETKSEVALGSRFLEGGGADNIAPMRYLLLKAATFFTRVTTGLKITDTHNGLRVFSRQGAEKIQITQNRMAHASEILSIIAEQKLPFVEVPVRIRYTEYSLRKGQRMSNSFNILWESFTGILRR